MKSLNNAGLCFALDDFGTGYSSMSYLKRLPISVIKIDQSFVSDIESDEFDSEIIKTIIQLANVLGTTTTAEGVETEGQYQFLKANGCTHLQGYYFSKPMLLKDLLKNIDNIN